MKAKLGYIIGILCSIFLPSFQLHGQGYIVPNGVTYAGESLFGTGIYGINVVHNPTTFEATGFGLEPMGQTPPTVYINTFLFGGVADVGVRVFQVFSNQPISLQPILSHSFTELLSPNSYVFNDGVPFYLALYTGNQVFNPPNGIYTDPLFGWVELVNNQGVIQMLGGALEYGSAGIIAGTQTIIQPVPEPSTFALAALGSLLLVWRRRQGRIQK